jgi:uncharacterized repeat protein (TIGR04076 family)
MSQKYDVEVTVKSQKGKCEFGHKPGDRIYFDGRTMKGELCYSVLAVLIESVAAMMYGMNYPWQKGDTLELACPDAANPVVFTLKRVPKTRR